MILFVWTHAATPAPAEKMEKNGKEGEKEEDKEDVEALVEKEKLKEKDRDEDEGKEVDGNKTADSTEVGRGPQNANQNLPAVQCLLNDSINLYNYAYFCFVSKTSCLISQISYLLHISSFHWKLKIIFYMQALQS